MIAPAYVVQVSDADGVLVLGIGGDLDLDSRDLVERVLLAAIGAAPTMVLDLRELTFCDSVGIAMFVAMQAKAEAGGTALAFRNVGPLVQRMFEIASIDSLLESRSHRAPDVETKPARIPSTERRRA
jgi:anti-anti-sigma factor